MNNNEKDYVKDLKAFTKKFVIDLDNIIADLQQKLENTEKKLLEATKNDIQSGIISEEMIKLNGEIKQLTDKSAEINSIRDAYKNFTNYFEYYEKLTQLRSKGFELYKSDKNRSKVEQIETDLENKLVSILKNHEDPKISEALDKYITREQKKLEKNNETVDVQKILSSYVESAKKSIKNISQKAFEAEELGENSKDFEQKCKLFEQKLQTALRRQDFDVKADLDELFSDDKEYRQKKDLIRDKYIKVLDMGLIDQMISSKEVLKLLVNSQKFEDWYKEEHPTLKNFEECQEYLLEILNSKEDEKTSEENEKTSDTEEPTNEVEEPVHNEEPIQVHEPVFISGVPAPEKPVIDVPAPSDNEDKKVADEKEPKTDNTPSNKPSTTNNTDSENKNKLDEELKKKASQVKKPTKRQKAVQTIKDNKGRIIAGIIAVAALVIALKSCNKSNKNSNTDTNTYDEPSITTTIDTDTTNDEDKTSVYTDETLAQIAESGDLTEEETKNIVISALTDLGYSEISATEMVNNWNEDTLQTVLKMERNEKIETYSNVKDFDINNLTEYESLRTTLHISAEDAVNYVEKAILIQETGYFSNGESINNIATIVYAFNTNNIIYTTYENQLSALITPLNKITNNYLIGNSSEKDKKALEALKLIADEDSEKDDFLEVYTAALQNLISNPNDQEAIQTIYDIKNIFAHSVNGFVNDSSVLTDDVDLNDAAIVDNRTEWLTLSKAIVGATTAIDKVYDGDTYDIEMKLWSLDLPVGGSTYDEQLINMKSYVVEYYSTSKDLQNLFDEDEIYSMKQDLINSLIDQINNSKESQEICNKYKAASITVPDAVESIYSDTTYDGIAYVKVRGR